MTVSGTYTYDPAVVELVEDGFDRVGINGDSINAQHLRTARRKLNLMFSSWANKGVRLWAVDRQTQALTQGTVTYTCATGTVSVLDMVLIQSGTETLIGPIDRFQYFAIPDKTQQGQPGMYWVERLITPQFRLWPAPENSTDSVAYYRLRRIQDVLTSAETFDAPYRWFDAIAAGLAARLAPMYAPDRIDTLERQANEAFGIAASEDVEHVNTRFDIDMSSYQ